MNRQLAAQTTRALLDLHGLNSWHVHLTTDVTKPFLGLCSYKDKTIILNAFHLDTHPDVEVINTIRHEVAHALCPGQQHNDIWALKARELGCDNTLACANYSLSEDAIDAIRSGAQLKVEFTEETHVVRTPKYTITRLQDKCTVCGKVAKVKSRREVNTSKGRKVVITLECLHIQFRDAESFSAFEDVIFDGDPKCRHSWGIGKDRTTCTKCRAHRLYEYQIEGARSVERANGRLAILDEQGLGKTIQSLAYLKFHPEAFPFLWITKSGIKFQHAKEIMRVLGRQAFPQILMTGKDTLIPGMSCIASYDIFRRLDLQMFKDHNFGSAILDECQAIKNPDSSRTGCVRQIVKEIPKIIPTSGTFWKNRGSEAFVMLNMLDPKMFYSFKAFKEKWVEYKIDPSTGKEKEGGLKPGFREAIAHIAIRRERAEAMPELPLISRNKLIAEVPDYARKAYEEEEDKLVDNYNDAVIGGTENTFEAQSKMMESLIVMRQIVGLAKVPSTVEFAQEFLEETDRKLVIFVHHKKCGELIAEQMLEWCNKNRMPAPLVMTSDLDASARFALQEKFNSPNARLMVASTLASGEGLNLQSCSDCIMHERQWNPANEEQAEGRFIRIGQNAQAVTATYVHGDETVDTILDRIVEGKRISYHNSMNKGDIPTWNEGSLMKDLIGAIVANKRRR